MEIVCASTINAKQCLVTYITLFNKLWARTVREFPDTGKLNHSFLVLIRERDKFKLKAFSYKEIRLEFKGAFDIVVR